MDLKIKLLKFPNSFNYLVVIAQGLIGSKALQRVFDEIEKSSRSLSNCGVLIDLEEASVRIPSSAIHALANQFGPNLKRNITKIAVVSSESPHCCRLYLLRDLLCGQSLRVAVFSDTKAAAAWLSEPA